MQVIIFCVYFIGSFQIFTSFGVFILKPTTDVLGGISKLDYLAMVSDYQRFPLD